MLPTLRAEIFRCIPKADSADLNAMGCCGVESTSSCLLFSRKLFSMLQIIQGRTVRAQIPSSFVNKRTILVTFWLHLLAQCFVPRTIFLQSAALPGTSPLHGSRIEESGGVLHSTTPTSIGSVIAICVSLPVRAMKHCRSSVAAFIACQARHSMGENMGSLDGFRSYRAV
jgi:hypothetical protein